MAQFFLYLTFILASSLSAGESVDTSTLSSVDQSLVYTELDSADGLKDSDDLSDTDSNVTTEYVIRYFTASFSFFSSRTALTHPTLGQFSIRAPPTLLA